MTLGEMYVKMQDRWLELVDLSFVDDSKQGSHFEYRRGFKEALDMVYDAIMDECEQEWESGMIIISEGGEEE